MTWIQANWLYLLMGWAVLHTIANSVAAALPQDSKWVKFAHVWLAINPLDVVKTIATVSGQVSVSGGVPTVKS